MIVAPSADDREDRADEHDPDCEPAALATPCSWSHSTAGLSAVARKMATKIQIRIPRAA